MRKRFTGIIFWAIVVLDAIALVVLALVLGGALGDGQPAGTSAAQGPAATRTPDSVAQPPTASPQPVAQQPPVTTSRAHQVKVVVKAARGDCWVSARAGGPNGRVLYAGVLPSGSTTSVVARKVWLELGAAGNVDLMVNGRPRPVTTGTSAFAVS